MTESSGSTFTFLFTDIEGSGHLWQDQEIAMRIALACHDGLLEQTITAHGGRVFKTVGDAFFSAFDTPLGALQAAIEIQRDLPRQEWNERVDIRVQIALHTGSAKPRHGDFTGPAIRRIARILESGHGGQILVSEWTKLLLGDTHSAEVQFRDLGVHRFKELARPQRIYQALAEDLVIDFPPLRSLDLRLTNLPAQASSFIAREAEIPESKQALVRTSLPTRVRTGDIDKTRLAMQVGTGLLDTFLDGVWFIDLASLTDATPIPRRIASVLSAREQRPGEPVLTSLTNALRDERLLLILDNSDHLIAACAQLASLMLRPRQSVKILATSREPPGVSGGIHHQLEPLAMLEPVLGRRASTFIRWDAAQLFLDRARAISPGFDLSEETAGPALEIVRQLHGIPLPIELAATRIHFLSPGQIAERLDDRLRLRDR